MRIVLRYNPLAGRGRAEAIADEAEQRLRRDGHEVRRVAISKSDPGALARALDWDQAGSVAATPSGGRADVLAVIGGDGTLHHALPDVLPRGTAVYHVPLGTENLFARQFGMDRDLERLAAAAARGSITQADVGLCNGVPFVLMCSMGPDANVVHRLAKVRRGRISHLSYLGPSLAEFCRPGFARLRVEVDGRTVVDGRSGLLVVANCRQYALRMDPAPRASITDGLLDVVFFPCETSVRVLLWGLSSRLGRHLESKGLVYATGSSVRAASLNAGGSLYQIDGEAGTGAPALDASAADQTSAAAGPGLVGALECAVRPGALRVLLP